MNQPLTKDGKHLIVPGNFFETLRNCKGYYTCPRDDEGKPAGRLVCYTASYKDNEGKDKKWVGLDYYNFSKADMWPAVLTHFAEAMAERLVAKHMVPDLIVGAPWAGVKFSQEVARILGCRHINLEKDGDGNLIPGRYDGEIIPGDIVLVGEELVNNTSTTGKMINIIEQSDGIVRGIFCAINRSYPFKSMFWNAPTGDPLPIFGVIEKETPQYKQDDPVVASEIAKGNIVWKPKYNWDKLNATT